MVSHEAASLPPQSLRRGERKERTRQELLDAARKLFAERGFHGTSTVDIAAAAGVTERTLFRHFPSKISLVLDEVMALLPELFRIIRERPAAERPYQAVCEGILEFGHEHPGLLVTVVGSPAGLRVPVDSRQRTLADLEDDLTMVLQDRYRLPPADQLHAAVWARASMSALRTALELAAQRPAGESTGRLIRACFAALTDQEPVSPDA
jgi:AcrR family transcriptional regulator